MEQAEKAGKKKWYLRWWMWIVYVIFIFVLVGALTGESDSSTSSESDNKEVAQQVEAMKVPASQISADYKANEVAADAKYKGKLVEITGTVEDIGKDVLDKPYVTFALGQYEIINKVQCYFSKKNESSLIDITQGEQITLRGTVEGGSFNIIVRECQVVE